MSKGKEPISPKTRGPKKRKNERETVEEKEETVGSQPCKRKRNHSQKSFPKWIDPSAQPRQTPA